MKKFCIFVCLSVFLTVTAFSQMQTRPETPAKPAPAGAPRAMANNDAAYVALRTIQVGTETVHVNNFTLTRDAGTFVFKSGVFRLLQPVNGKITGAVFTGDASFALKPPIAVEQRYLGILTKGQPFQEEFGSAVFRFTDGTEQEIRKAAANDSSPATGDAGGLLDDVRQQLRKKLKTNLDARLLADVLSSKQGGMFIAFIKGRKYSDKMIYEIDPEGVTKPEEIALTTWDDTHDGVWAAFHYSNEYKAGTANSDEQNYRFTVEHQKLDATIERNAHLNATAETKIIALQDGVHVLGLDLYRTLRVESVTAEGQQLSFIQEDKDQDADFAVILPRELKKGESYTLVTKYGGKDAVSNEGGGQLLPHCTRELVSGPGLWQLRQLRHDLPCAQGHEDGGNGKEIEGH